MTFSIAAAAAPATASLNVQTPAQPEANVEAAAPKQAQEDHNAMASPYALDATTLAMSAIYDCRKAEETDPTFNRIAMIEAGFEHMKTLFAPAQEADQAQGAALDMAM